MLSHFGFFQFTLQMGME